MTLTEKRRVDFANKVSLALTRLLDDHQEEFEILLGAQMHQTCRSAHQEPGSPIPRSEMDLTFKHVKKPELAQDAIKITIETIHSRDAIVR